MHCYTAGFMPAKADFSFYCGSTLPHSFSLFEAGGRQQHDFHHTWDVEGFEKGVYSAHVSSDSSHFACGSGDRHVSLVSINAYE